MTTIQRPRLADLLDLDELADEIEAGYVTRKRNPTLPLSIYCYTHTAQHERRWNPITMRARALIVDDETERIAAFAIPKFFEAGEHLPEDLAASQAPRDEPFEVYDKADGSLGVIFHHSGAWHAASKSSFTSDQARWAAGWLQRHPAHAETLDPANTYITEIIYPANRLVIDYGDTATLLLLAVFRPDGTEAPLTEHAQDWRGIGGQVVRTWPPLPLKQLRELTATNTKPDGRKSNGTDAEGFVIRYASGHRIKVKYDEYRRLSKLLKHYNNRDIWRAAAVSALDPGLSLKKTAAALYCPTEEVAALRSQDAPLQNLLRFASEHFADWARELFARYAAEAAELTEAIETADEQRRHLAGDRAAYFNSVADLPATVGAGALLRLSGGDYTLHVWHHICPDKAIDYTGLDEEA